MKQIIINNVNNILEEWMHGLTNDESMINILATYRKKHKNHPLLFKSAIDNYIAMLDKYDYDEAVNTLNTLLKIEKKIKVKKVKIQIEVRHGREYIIRGA